MPLRAADPIQITLVTSLTGFAAAFGQGTSKAVALVIDGANKRGGVRGRQLKLNVLDDGSNPQNAVQLVGSLIGKTQVIIGPQITASCLAVAPLLRTGPVAYCLTPGVLPPPGSFYFSAGNNNDDNMAVMIRYFRERGWKRIALITSTDATGQAVDRGTLYAINLLENRALTLVAQEHFGLTDVSVSAQMSRIKAANPDAIIAWANGPPFGTLLRGIKDAGISAPIGASPGILIPAVIKQFAPLLPKELYFPGSGALTPESTPPGKQRDAQAAFYKAYRDSGDTPDFVSVSSWDPAMIVVDALKTLGADASADQIRNYIATLHGWVGILGTYDFRDGSQRGIGQASCVIDRFDLATNRVVALSGPGGYLR
jgi:branched-chain amino acid transport system substrate-binding protein